MSSNLRTSRQDVRRLVTLGRLAVALILAGSAALLAFASTTVDRLQAREERLLVERTLARFEERLAADVTTATVWDQAYEMLRPGGDVAWADAEIGTYYANNRGHDRTVVFDEADQPFYAYAFDRRVRPDELARFQRDVQPLLEAVRRSEQRGPRPGPQQKPTTPSLAIVKTGVVRSEGVTYLVAASTVAPEVWAAPRRPGKAVVVVSAQRMDQQLLTALKDELRVDAAAIRSSPGPGEAALPLVDAAGRPAGDIVWKVKRPGLAALKDAAPVIGAGLVMLLLVVAAVRSQVQAILRRLDAKEDDLSRVMAELVSARDEAQAANRAKSEFLANMSHEIRTPLNGVLGMVQVMERSDLEAPHRERLKIIRDSGETLLGVLNDILDLSKIEAGKLELEMMDFDLEAAVDAACRPFAALAVGKAVGFEIEVAPQVLGAWRGDGARLRQILGNLVANAVKFTYEGKVTVVVEPAPEGLSFTVSDTGVGISKAVIPELFSKFVQADGSTSRRFGGTGLGLAICRELVELMDGRISVSSQEGIGSTFTVVLPLTRGAADAMPPAHRAEPEHLAARVLAAEDNTTNQLLLQALLEPMGVELVMAANGLEASAIFEAETFDLVLMDVQMPLMNGVEATEAIRAFETRCGRAPTPILALSANVMTHQVESYLAAGMDAVVAKPIDAAQLLTAIQAALEARAEPKADSRAGLETG